MTKEFEVGMGATICVGSDRYAGTIIKVTRKTVVVQHDIVSRIDSNGMSDDQQYTYTKNPYGLTERFYRLGDGIYKNGSKYLIFGKHHYYDFSF